MDPKELSDNILVKLDSEEKKEPRSDMDRKASGKLRDSYMGRIPDEDRAISVKFAWHELWSKVIGYLSREELMTLGEALVMAGSAHKDQKRSTGDPYIVHCINVASILADMQLDNVTLVSALLHDVIEDTDITAEKLKSAFGSEVATLVDGVTKLGKLPFKSFEDYQAENLRKMFVVMAKDIRVVLIKLADRLHNMRTLGALRKDKQMRIARETLEIYAPLAHRLGIYQVKRGLEDLAFKYADPEMYYEIRRRVRKKLPERETVIRKAMEILTARLEEDGIQCRVKGRAKHFYSIYEKVNRKKLPVEQLYDLLALRVVVEDIAACYTVLGIVHTIWKPIPGQFDDYIANPKSNMYQSLHTTVVGPTGEPLEVQIRTREMNSLAEYGIAAHWRYKEGSGRLDDLDARLTWIRQALEGDHDGSQDPSEFLERLKDDVLSSEVFVFTPQGEVVSLPRGSTPLDFAFAIHTQVGMRCVGAMVNNRIVAMGYELQNGDIVKIITSPQGSPSRDWLKIARSSKARGKIRAYFRAQEKTERAEKLQRGRELLDREIKKRGTPEYEDFEELTPLLNKIARDVGLSNGEELLAAVGAGNQSVSQIAQRLAGKAQSQIQPSPQLPPEPEKQTGFSGPRGESEIIVEGAEGVQVQLSNCCEPVPGDPIVGYSTRTRGITVHRADCENLKNAREERLVSVSWNATENKRYTARLKLEALDRGGIFGDVAQAILAGDGAMVGVKAGVVGGNLARMKIEVRVKNVEHLYSIVAKLNAVKGMLDVSRG